MEERRPQFSCVSFSCPTLKSQTMRLLIGQSVPSLASDWSGHMSSPRGVASCLKFGECLQISLHIRAHPPRILIQYI